MRMGNGTCKEVLCILEFRDIFLSGTKLNNRVGVVEARAVGTQATISSYRQWM